MPDKSTFMRMREDEREIRKTLIINAAMMLFDRTAFQDIGMRDIAKEAGVSAASIYRYFPSRDDLFAEALIRDMIIIEQRFERMADDDDAGIKDFAVTIVDYVLENEGTYQMMSYFMAREDMEQQILRRFSAVQGHFLDLLDQVIIKTTGAKENVRFASQAFYASLFGLIMTFKNFPGKSKSARREHMHNLAKLVTDIFINGISSIQKS